MADTTWQNAKQEMTINVFKTDINNNFEIQKKKTAFWKIVIKLVLSQSQTRSLMTIFFFLLVGKRGGH